MQVHWEVQDIKNIKFPVEKRRKKYGSTKRKNRRDSEKDFNFILGSIKMRNKNTRQPRSTTISKPLLPYRKEKNQQKLKYYVGPGNNASLVRKVLSTRPNWEEVKDSKYLFLNFRWQQTTRGFSFDNCIESKVFKQCLNHFQFHHELTNKENLLRNLMEYCDVNKINTFDFVPVTFCLNLADSNFENSQNHFLKFYELHLPPEMKSEKKKHWLNLPKKRFTTNVEKKISYFYCKPEIRDVYLAEDSQYLWILKPTFWNQGHGIHVFNDLQKLQDILRSYIDSPPLQIDEHHHSRMVRSSIIETNPVQENRTKTFRIRDIQNSRPRPSSFIIQKYLQKPLLFEGRKFDLRIWVLITHQFKVYFYREGYMRTSSFLYNSSAEKMEDFGIHLTNNAVQKNVKGYGKFEEGNQLSFRSLKNVINRSGGSFEKTIEQMKRIVRITCLSTKKKINKLSRHWCFELFGYDFMIDEKCRPWLIEVNTNPSLQESSLLLQNLLPRMLDDSFKLTLDTVFPESSDGNKASYVLQHYQNQDNLWQFVIDLKKGLL